MCRGDWIRTSDLLTPSQTRYPDCATPRDRCGGTFHSYYKYCKYRPTLQPASFSKIRIAIIPRRSGAAPYGLRYSRNSLNTVAMSSGRGAST